MSKHGAVTKVTIKATGLAQLRTAPAVRADLERRARNIAKTATANAAAAGYDELRGKDREGMDVDTGTGKGRNRRPRASVRTGTVPAMKAEATHRALTKAIQAGRE